MECSFIDKYVDKIYCGTMSFFDSKALNKHMKTCPKCKSAYEDIIEENEKLKDAVLCEPPLQIGINVMKSIEGDKRKERRIYGMRRYMAAAAAIVLLAVSSLYCLRYMGNLKNVGAGKTPEVQELTADNAELRNVLEDYLKQNRGKASKGGQMFAAVDIFGVLPLEGSEDTYMVYLWALVEEYAWDQGLSKGFEESLPMVVHVKRDGDGYKSMLYHTELNSSMDVKDLAEDYGDKISARRFDVFDLDEKIKKEALDYYKEHDAPFEPTQFQRLAKVLIEKHGWTWTYNETTMDVEIPSTFIDRPGEFPVGLYWAYCNVLSKDAGLDMEHYKGMMVTAHMMPLAEPFGDTPNKGVRAVAIEKDGKLIGAWIDKGRAGGPWASLSRNYFDTITGKSWGQWLIDEGIEDNIKGYESELKKLTPEQVTEKYYEALDKKDEKTAFSFLSKASQMEYLWVNMDDNMLYNEDFETGSEEILSAKVIRIEQWPNFDNKVYGKGGSEDKRLNRQVSDAKEFVADVDMDLKENMVLDDGLNSRFIILVKESSDSPWKIDGNGTGL